MTWIYGGSLLGLFGLGLPIAATLILVGAIGVLIASVPLSIVAQRVAFGLDSFTLIAIPMFLLMGNLMNASGVSNRIFDFASAMVGHWRAGLSQVNIINSVIFSGMSGSALADAAGMGAIEIKAMIRKGYRPAYAAAVSAASCTVGPVIPPSIAAVLYAFIADVSVGRMFLAGVIPGLLMTAAMMITVYIRSDAVRVPREPKATRAVRWSTFWRALPALVCPIILIGGMRVGVFTPTELAAVGVLYALLLGLLYHREADRREMLEALRQTALTTGAVMIIVAGANVLAWILARERIPQELTEAVVTMQLTPLQFLLMFNLVLILLDMVLDTTGIMILATPVVVPAAVALGIDPVHLGMVMIVNMMIGLLTPPVGMALFVVSNLAEVSVEAVAKEALPFVGALAAVLVLITLFPQIVLLLPDLVYGVARP